MIKQYQNKEWLEKKYIGEKLSTRQVGKLCGVSHFAISCWLKEYNILIRSISESKLGKPSWNKDLTKETDIRVSLSEEHKQKISKANKGHIGWNKGIPCTEETKRKIRETNGGEKCHLWKGGITPLILSVRSNYKYRQWKSDVFTRDNFTCQLCGSKDYKLNTHHIKSVNSILQKYEITNIEEAFKCEELWNINNGITFCEECHKRIHKELYINKKNKRKEVV